LTLERSQVLAYLSRPDVASTHVVSTSDLYDQQGVYGTTRNWSRLPIRFIRRRAAMRPRLMTLGARGVENILYVCRTCTRPEVQPHSPAARISTKSRLGATYWKLFNVRRESLILWDA